MSYSCMISFKTIEANKLYDFFQQLKLKTIEKFPEIAEDNFIFLPSVRNAGLLKDANEWILGEINEKWVLDGMFRFRYFYLSQHYLLGVFGIPTALREMFDTTIGFQSSCDQNYDYSYWKGVPIFEELAERWRTVSNEIIISKLFGKIDEELDRDGNFEYWRKTFAYEAIWGMIEDYLFNDTSCVYLSLFGGYELNHIQRFIYLCESAYGEWLKKIETKKEKS